jgi:hypothetical protein
VEIQASPSSAVAEHIISASFWHVILNTPLLNISSTVHFFRGKMQQHFRELWSVGGERRILQYISMSLNRTK